MIIEVNSIEYRNFFPSNPHAFISDEFIDLNKSKAERILRLVEDTKKPGLGLIAGLINGVLHSHFSAPFGGFHFRDKNIYIDKIDNYIICLKDFIMSNNLEGIKISLPPDIYNLSFNSKVISSLNRNGFVFKTPDITNWVNLGNFNGSLSQKNSRELYRQACRNDLKFQIVDDYERKLEVFTLICDNRKKFGRPIYMTFKDILDTSELWPVDFFIVESPKNEILSSAIFYRNHRHIVYAAYWGDNELGRSLKAMDYMINNLWKHYSDMKMGFIDLGISTESGMPNTGLLRFKESHDAESSLRYKFTWSQ